MFGRRLLPTCEFPELFSSRFTRYWALISAGGTRRTLIDGLPSGLSAPENDPDGPTALLLDGTTLYIAIGEGDQLANGTQQGTTIANPKGPSSPIMSTVLRVEFSQSVDRIQSAFTLKPADHFAILDNNPVPFDNGAGDRATITQLAGFRIIPDAATIYRNSHPYGLARLDSDPNHLYLADAGMNALVQIDTATGRARTITHFGVQPNLSGFGPTNSRVVLVDPATGKVDPFINWLSSTIDIVYRIAPARTLSSSCSNTARIC